MKFYQKRGFALVVLVLAILGSCVYGISKKPADLPQVSYGNWLRDDADLLTDETEASLRQYDQSWDSDYRAIIAVATLDTLNGWTYEKAAAELGSQWGLGGNDMLLLLVKDSDYYVALGDNVLDAMTDTYQAGLQGAVEAPYYQGDYDAAALAFFRQADVFYAQTLGRIPIMRITVRGRAMTPALWRLWCCWWWVSLWCGSCWMACGIAGIAAARWW